MKSSDEVTEQNANENLKMTHKLLCFADTWF